MRSSRPAGSIAVLSAALAVGVCAASARAEPAPEAVRPAPPATQPGLVVLFQPHVRIDYGRRQVEVDGEVVLREGQLELFACSPGTREYESIVRLNTRPVVIFQALGLLGLEPGRPLRLNFDTLETIPASGDAVEIEVRYEADDTQHSVPIETWMRHARSGRPLDRQPWVFAGSISQGNGNLAADEEGTIIAVVDFESALIALPRLHTSSNEELWLEPNTPAIPEVGTRCTVVFRPGPLQLRLDERGRLYLGRKPVTFGEAARRLRGFVEENPGIGVELDVAAASPASDREQLQRLLEALRVDVRRPAATQPATREPAATAPAAAPSARATPDDG